MDSLQKDDNAACPFHPEDNVKCTYLQSRHAGHIVQPQTSQGQKDIGYEQLQAMLVKVFTKCVLFQIYDGG